MDNITKIFESVFKISTVEAERNLRMDEVATWDSLSHMDLIVALEDEYQIQLSGDDIAEMLSFDDIRKIISNYAISK